MLHTHGWRGAACGSTLASTSPHPAPCSTALPQLARPPRRRPQLFTCAESLGAVESLAESPAIMTHASVPPEIRAQLGISDALVRLSVGLEVRARGAQAGGGDGGGTVRWCCAMQGALLGSRSHHLPHTPTSPTRRRFCSQDIADLKADVNQALAAATAAVAKAGGAQ